MIIYKKSLPTVRQSIRERGGFRKEKREDNFIFLSSKQCFTRSVFQRAEYTRADGRRKSVWRERGKEGRRGRKTEVDQQMVMDGDRGAVSPQWAEQMLRWDRLMPRVRSEGSERVGTCGALSPVCPVGRRVCDDRSPVASPEPSSQRPGSYCFSPFGCPAKGMKQTDTFTGDTANHRIWLLTPKTPK